MSRAPWNNVSDGNTCGVSAYGIVALKLRTAGSNQPGILSMFTCDIKRLRKDRRITYFMAKRNNNKNKAQVIKYDTNTSISKEQMIEIQAEAE